MNSYEKIIMLLSQRFITPPKALVQTFGCVQNENDSEKIRGVLYNIGYSQASSLADSDIVVFNTCAIRENAELKIFGNIGKLKALKANNPNMIIAICGCMVMQPHIVKKIISSYPFVDIVFGVNAIQDIVSFIETYYTTNKRQIAPPNVNEDIVEDIPIARQSSIKASISIMYGCDNFCSYCIVPYVRGRERSRSPHDIIEEFKLLVTQGYKDITLLGQNVNSYGKNLNENVDFADLLKSLCKIDGDYIIHFMSSHPKDIDKKLIDVIRDNVQISRQLHLPVQSGSDKILSEMNRKYTIQDYWDIVNYARSEIPEIGFSSDIIVGFPGETLEDYLATENLVKEICFTQLFTFIYSKRVGTAAYEINDETSYEEKTQRLNRLIKLQQDIFFNYLASFTNKTVRALVEEKRGNMYFAKLSNTLNVTFKSDTDCLNQFIELKIIGKKGTTLTAEPLNI